MHMSAYANIKHEKIIMLPPRSLIEQAARLSRATASGHQTRPHWTNYGQRLVTNRYQPILNNGARVKLTSSCLGIKCHPTQSNSENDGINYTLGVILSTYISLVGIKQTRQKMSVSIYSVTKQVMESILRHFSKATEDNALVNTSAGLHVPGIC